MLIEVPFKINLGLYVTRKRQDGYHDIETVFYPVHNVTDKIEMTEGEGKIAFSMTGGDFEIEPDKNLCVKAFKVLQKEYGLPGVKIHLTKRIPSGAGLGGGSSDAAGVLKLTNELFNLHIPNQLLKDYAAQLGSDVPFFIDGRPAYATGRGEVLHPINLNLEHKKISIFKPDFSISTAEAYAHIHPIEGRTPLCEVIREDANKWHFILPNDFENSLFEKFTQLSEIKDKYYELGADYAALSGSGSAIFAISEKTIDLSPYFRGQNL